MAEANSLDAVATVSSVARQSSRKQLAFATLSIPAFRFLVLAETFGFMAFNTRLMVQGWVIVELTDSDAWVGLAGGLPAIPVIGFALVGGVLIDRLDRRRLQVGMFLAISATGFITGLLITLDLIELWHLVALAFPVALITTVRMTAGASMVVDVVGRDRIFGANAVVSAATNLGRFIGPAAGGFLIAQYGTDVAFYAIAVVLLIASGLMWFVESEPTVKRTDQNSIATDLKEGLQYIGRTPELRWLAVLALSLITAGMSFPMVPRWTRDVLDAGPEGYGFILAAGGIGGLVGAFSLMATGNVTNLARVLVITATVWSAAIIAFAFTSSLVVAAIMFGITGAAVAWWANTLRTMFQLAAKDEMRGRVMSLFGLVSQAIAFGWLLGGLLSEGIGPRATFIVAALAVWTLYTFAYLKSEELRRIGR